MEIFSIDLWISRLTVMCVGPCGTISKSFALICYRIPSIEADALWIIETLV
jgi:hypothetical protein